MICIVTQKRRDCYAMKKNTFDTVTQLLELCESPHQEQAACSLLLFIAPKRNLPEDATVRVECTRILLAYLRCLGPVFYVLRGAESFARQRLLKHSNSQLFVHFRGF
jgi:hypothetical protein